MKASILVIDDNIEFLNWFKKVFIDEYNIHCTNEGAKGKSVLKNYTVDVC
jgi:response regulator RpfG family c-di-GMP phosphodiesterase